MINNLSRLLIKGGNNLERNCYIWNMIAGVINASQAVILLMVIRRTNQIADAGILTIAFAIANLLLCIGKYGMRAYQVTDVNERFEFSTYLSSRIVTVVSMVLVSLFYSLYGIMFQHYTITKAAIIFGVCLLYAVECIEDVFFGLYQHKGRLDVGAKIFSFRWLVVLASFVVCLICFENLLFAVTISVAIAIFMLTILLLSTYSAIEHQRLRISIKGTRVLLYYCTPLFISSFCSFYIANAPKYAIDKYMSDDIQACYGFVAMPIFVIGLINGFLYQPILVKMACEWQAGKQNRFISRIKKQLLIIIGITIICIIGALLMGIPVLSIIYNTDLTEYKKELIILLLGGGMLAISGFLNVLMTIMRCQKELMYAYIGAALLGKVLSDIFVKSFGTIGAAWIYFILMTTLTIIFFLLMKRKINN